MRRIVLFGMGTLTVLVLLFGYHTSTSSRAAGGATSVIASPGASSTSGDLTAAGTQPAATTASGAASGSSSSGTVTGDVAQTRWGPVQVQLTIKSGKITGVDVVEYPNNNGRDQQINSYALPILVQETISAQSASIDMVSGATVTSDGYLTSLQSALDKAGI
jgi:uncharacterized protein with FMN-binding domain